MEYCIKGVENKGGIGLIEEIHCNSDLGVVPTK